VSDISKRKRRNTSSTSSVSKYSKDDIPPDISIPQKKNLAHYSYPEHEATLKREPLCPHLKRNARDKPLGHAFILQAHASSFAKYFHLDNTTLYCLKCCSSFQSIHEIPSLENGMEGCHRSMFTGELCDSPLFIERDTLGIFCVGCRKFIFRDNIFDDLKTLKGLAESTLNWYVTPNMKKQHMLVCMQEKINLKRRAVDAWKYVNEQKCPTPEISTDVENPEVQSLDGNDRFYTSQPNFHA